MNEVVLKIGLTVFEGDGSGNPEISIVWRRLVRGLAHGETIRMGRER